jgi:UDP:flavonoid glycosyltransferase YjiC (YdhE family)
VRVLITTFPSIGHFHPLAPLALAISGRGHDVLVATGSDLVGWVRRCGLPAVSAGLRQREAVCRARASVAPAHTFGLHMFAEVAPAPMLADLREIAGRWPPDLIVHEEGEYAGPLLAALLNRPCVTHSWPAPALPVDARGRAVASVTPLWRELLDRPAQVTGDMYLDTCPPPLQSADVATIPAVTVVRPEPFDGVRSPLPAALHRLARPAAYVTFGTVADFSDPDRLATVARAAATEAVAVVLTTGPNDPARIGHLPANVYVERYLVQRQVFNVSDVVVSHGGAGTAVGALLAGLPQLVLPQGAPSQDRLAERLSAIGVGLSLPPGQQGADRVRRDLRRLLHDASFADRARRVARELRHIPGPEQVVDEILHLCR